MKPAPFRYFAPRFLDEALDLLHAEEATVLAGGQSLLLEMAYRDARPQCVVDINQLTELDQLKVDDELVSIGALVRHRAFDSDHRQQQEPVLRLLHRAAPLVAHPPIRARGTFCGSIAWAHPHSEWNAIVVACRGTVHTRSRSSGARGVAASAWFEGDRRSARHPDELVVAVTIPRLPASTGVGFAEHRRTAASFADVAAAVSLTVADGAVTRAQVGLAGVAERPIVGTQYETALTGRVLADAADAVAEVSLSSGDRYRDAVATELVCRAVQQSVGDLG
ncbi:MAG: molybdopterin dehydrogenase, FAD-binding protein [Pseudonocardiales bacterium]|nr:molybdopterin dehydrogenase, FAD-binding protein [Pseudonocardiales bacterium]